MHTFSSGHKIISLITNINHNELINKKTRLLVIKNIFSSKLYLLIQSNNRFIFLIILILKIIS